MVEEFFPAKLGVERFGVDWFGFRDIGRDYTEESGEFMVEMKSALGEAMFIRHVHLC